MAAEPDIPWKRIAGFVRQHTHNVRNGLNSLDLEASLLQDLVNDEEGRACVGRVRRQVRTLAEQMRTLSSLFQEPQAIAAPIVSRELLAIWREQQAGLPSSCEVEWVDKLGTEKVNVDVGLMATVFRELLTNAATFYQGGPITATARRDGDKVVFELREPKTEVLDPSDWGQAFSTTRRNGYGLGLWSARRLAEATGATIARHHIPEEKALITRITVPVA